MINKVLFLAFIFSLSLQSQELSLDEGTSLTIDVGSYININGLELIPSSEFIINGENAITTSNVPISVGGNESIALAFLNLYSINNFTGTIKFHYDDSNLNGLDENKLILEIEDDFNSWNSHQADLDTNLNTLTQIFSTPINFLTVTASSSDAPLNIKNNFNEFGAVSLFPNPTSSLIYIKSEHVFYAELFNLLGNRILSTYSDKIDLSQLASSMYLLKITEKNTGKYNIYKIVKN